MGFNLYLKGELEYRGMLVKELAHITGIPKKTIDKYLLTDGTMPPADKAVDIAKALGVTVEYLVSGKKTVENNTQNHYLSPEARLISELIEDLSREKRKIAVKTVQELVEQLKQPIDNKPQELNLLQSIFLKLFLK